MAFLTPYLRAKFPTVKIAEPHPHDVQEIKWDIEGEELTREQIILRCPDVKARIVLARLHSGCRKWKFLQLPNETTLYRVNQRRRMDSFNHMRADIEAKKAKPLSAHAKLK